MGGLLPLDEVRRRLRIVGQSYVGLREVPLDRIVGSVDRSDDFDRGFTARRSLSRSRLASLEAAFPDGSMPPIEVFEVGGLYFVADGHHRVVLARKRGARRPNGTVPWCRISTTSKSEVRARTTCARSRWTSRSGRSPSSPGSPGRASPRSYSARSRRSRSA